MLHTFAQFGLGMKYCSGEGAPQDYTEALKWYRKAAEQGHALAQFILGDIMYYGKGVPKDYTEALKWCRKAAEQGNAPAQYMLGNMYEYGRGVSKDYKEAAEWYHKGDSILVDTSNKYRTIKASSTSDEVIIDITLFNNKDYDISVESTCWKMVNLVDYNKSISWGSKPTDDENKIKKVFAFSSDSGETKKANLNDWVITLRSKYNGAICSLSKSALN